MLPSGGMKKSNNSFLNVEYSGEESVSKFLRVSTILVIGVTAGYRAYHIHSSHFQHTTVGKETPQNRKL